MTRRGDIPITELVNEGLADLTNYFPNDSDGADMVTAMNRRKRIQNDRPSASSRKDSIYVQPVELPDYVVSNIIELDGHRWKYENLLDSPVALRRVFIERNQLIELDIEESLSWLSASLGSPRYEEVKSQLEQEADINNVNNQIILQLMYDRVEQGLPILEKSKNRLNTK